MNIIRLFCLSPLFFISAFAIAQDVPTHIQEGILLKAPEIDADKDGKITVDELKKTYPHLPPRLQRKLSKQVPGITDQKPAAKPKANKGTFEFTRDAGDHAVGKQKGYNCVFLGHSFFVPIIRHIEGHAQALGLDQHQQYAAFSGGASGSPGKLWSGSRKSALHAKTLLASGKVEMLAMTGHYVGSTLEDYSKWIDLALKHNPKTIFVIQCPWSIKKGKTLATYTETVKGSLNKAHTMVDALKKKYPNSTFHLVPQSAWMVELWKLYEAEKLPEITELVKRGEGLFSDEFGHGGTLAVKEGALMWLRILYGTDLTKYQYSTNTQYDLKALAQKLADEPPYAKQVN